MYNFIHISELQVFCDIVKVYHTLSACHLFIINALFSINAFGCHLNTTDMITTFLLDTGMWAETKLP